MLRLTCSKMNENSLAFTSKLNQERFSENLTLSWSSAVYLKLAIRKRFNLHALGLLRLYLLCIMVMYGISVMRERIWLGLYLNFTSIKMRLFSKRSIPYYK